MDVDFSRVVRLRGCPQKSVKTSSGELANCLDMACEPAYYRVIARRTPPPLPLPPSSSHRRVVRRQSIRRAIEISFRDRDSVSRALRGLRLAPAASRIALKLKHLRAAERDNAHVHTRPFPFPAHRSLRLTAVALAS